MQRAHRMSWWGGRQSSRALGSSADISSGPLPLRTLDNIRFLKPCYSMAFSMMLLISRELCFCGSLTL